MALTVPSIPAGGGVHSAPRSASTGVRFTELFGDKSLFEKGFATQLHGQVQDMQTKIAAGTRIDLREMISYQIKAGQLGLHVELISKVAESVLTTVRKLQTNQ